MNYKNLLAEVLNAIKLLRNSEYTRFLLAFSNVIDPDCIHTSLTDNNHLCILVEDAITHITVFYTFDSTTGDLKGVSAEA